MSASTPLGLDDKALAACVNCGLCLPHCPTYRVTGDERRSPRGRISRMRAGEWEGLQPDDEWHEAMDTCVQCLGCVTACPSGVPYGDLIAATRAAAARARPPARRLRVGLWILGRPRLLRWASRALAVIQRVGLVRLASASVRGALPPRLPVRYRTRREAGVAEVANAGHAEVVLFTGCVMDAWQSEVHDAVVEVLEAIEVTVERSGDRSGCCGALHGHAGMVEQEREHAERVIQTIGTDRPVLVDSAGCGAALKAYGELLATPVAREFASQVADIHEWLAVDPRLAALREASGSGDQADGDAVIAQDPCHLQHAQGCHGAVRDVLAPHMPLVELDDEGLCCGAGGAYSVVQPDLATAVRERKVAAISRAAVRSGASTVVSANPGCAMHLAAAGLSVRHPMELLADVLRARKTFEAGVGDGR